MLARLALLSLAFTAAQGLRYLGDLVPPLMGG